MAASQESHSRNLIKSMVRNYLESFVIAIAAGLLIRFMILAPYSIPNSTMSPTLEAGDFVFGLRVPFGVEIPVLNKKLGSPRTPSRGDLISFRNPNNSDEYFVKRVIGLPGDRIEIRGGRLWINDIPSKYFKISSAESRENETLLWEQPDPKTGYQVSVLPGAMKAVQTVLVPQGSVYVLSDRRIATDDSRTLGAIPLSFVESRIFGIWMSVGRAPGQTLRWTRVMQAVH